MTLYVQVTWPWAIFSDLRINSNSNSFIKIDRTEKTKLNFTSRFDTCLWTVSNHKYRRCTHTVNREIHEWSPNIHNNSSRYEDEIQFCLEESLEETLMKISVDLLTKYYELQCITLTQSGYLIRYKIISHSKALYYYRKCEYMKLLNTCDSIISQEMSISDESKHPMFLPDYQDMFSVSVMFASQTFFKKDVTCLTGLITLVDPSWFNSNKTSLEELKNSTWSMKQKYSQGKLGGNRRIYFLTRVRCIFLVHYLRFQSLIQLHFPKSDILSAMSDLKQSSSGLIFEDILLLFIGRTLKRPQRWIVLKFILTLA